MLILEGLLLAPALLLLVPAATFAGEVFLARRRPQADKQNHPFTADGPRPRAVVLIPAHNEATGIVGTLQSVRSQLGPDDRMLVVADNCSDDTAERARAEGAIVVERFDTALRGKGYALDRGIRWLEEQEQQGVAAPAVVVFVDADCTLSPGSLERMSREAVRLGRPVQILDLMHAPPGAPLQQKVAEFAWLVKNQVRPLGLKALGLPCQLMGTGMAIPWHLVRDAHMASGHLAEDMELGLAFAEAGVAPVFCPEASVHSRFPMQAAGGQAQRRRWEHGHLAMIRARGLPMLWRGLITRQPELLAIALDMCVPPLASLVAAQLGLLLLTAIFWLVSGAALPLLLVLAGWLAVCVAVGLAWSRFGRGVLSAAEWAAIPGYVLAKLPIYRDALLGRRAGWQRAQRDADAPGVPPKEPPSQP
ncbi:MAG: glycosyltransferase [Rubrivivax sp.]|nr:glycosyltransferase [Rubrivivax sp.]